MFSLSLNPHSDLGKLNAGSKDTSNSFQGYIFDAPKPCERWALLNFTEEETEAPGKQLIQSPTAPSCGMGPGWQWLVESRGFQMSWGTHCEEILLKKYIHILFLLQLY